MVCFVSRLLGKVRGMFSNANLFRGYFLNWRALRIFLIIGNFCDYFSFWFFESCLHDLYLSSHKP